MVARKTKRLAMVTALSASMVVAGAAAFAHEDGAEVPCPRGNGKGLGHGHPGKGKGNGLERGWPHKCEKHENNGGGNPGGDTTPGGGGTTPGGGGTTPGGGGTTPGGGGTTPGGDSTPGGSDTGDDHGISVEVNVEVNLPYIGVPNAAVIVGGVVDHAVTTAQHAITMAESDVANLMGIVQANVSLTGTGTVNVSGTGYLLGSVLAAI